MEQVKHFFDDRQATWLKARLKPSLNTDEQNQLHQDATEKFALANWLPDAAKRAGQLTMVSHPGKFSHPSAKTSSVIANNIPAQDGYLRSGNVDYPLDVFGNAAAMDVYKFLSLEMGDGQTVLSHLEQDSPAVQALMAIPTASYQQLKQGFLGIKQLAESSKTDHLVKQVYFPVDGEYHLLSIMTASGLLTQLKSRIDQMRFSEQAKQARENRKKNLHHADGYDDLPNLTVTAFGGTQPQNVSVLNSQNAGRAYLLASIPPGFQQRQARLPSQNFFKNSLNPKRFKDEFEPLDKLIRTDLNNVHIREGIRNCLKYLIDRVLQRAFAVRAFGVGWSQTEHYQNLPQAQRIWLDDAYLEQRQKEDEWLEEIVLAFANWILDSYELLFKQTCTQLSDYELREVKRYVELAVSDDQEFFK
ncbi:type I-F CRISPR-associated protein Csy1 [Methylomonas koyamae]|uniref:Type I-F CRISPR-associated protein Csy1 n=1 Tax=Methylomonas koyamae TaxID=702114 RepID=A0A177N957_9GAMM|nr:type I-F CRISPR-associated protein Csy1 [Methylomonas koyamae]OAI14425.1 type I-F CRISPR-associated protein Csy1 [Methylomonas koyamae]